MSLTRSLGGPPGPNFYLVALRAGLTSSFAPFGRSGRVTHATMRSLVSVIGTLLIFKFDAICWNFSFDSFLSPYLHHAKVFFYFIFFLFFSSFFFLAQDIHENNCVHNNPVESVDHHLKYLGARR